VRFKNQGLDAIEVQDNGEGISPHNYETLALKHHTSKLSTYSDLTTLQTFGFRGEALSSLCALSQFSVITCMAKDAPKGTKLEFEVSGKLKGTSVVAAQKGTTVTVENLFNNLPVRRRELERNIKREWGKVVGHLGQYACIQTGIKFSVTQQAGKGRKTTLFSTKGNQTTRENIINVFGAKTLTALITLDLNLELEPTNAPSQRWTTQEDGGKKEIRIVGHISRPASGEGRQTPDRQMFFVNSRPCGLPQVAKAFNEVYKSYNGSQSPFIFANIELDTHMYDVNVSPDKRTILLHDQNRMLENLKEALIALFESQDYTVPISQLPTQKQPAYKQLTISRESTVTREILSPSMTPQPEPGKAPHTPGAATEDPESENGSRAPVRGQSADSASLRKAYNPAVRGSAVSRELMSKDQGTVSLISNWLGRKTEDRLDASSETPKTVTAQPEGLSKEKRKLVENLSKSGQNTSSREVSEYVDSPPAEGQSPSLFVTDSREPSIERQRSRSIAESENSPERPIPSLQSAPKPTPSIADRFTITPRSYRPSAEIATITIGDHTTTSSIGTPFSSKKARIDNSPSIARGRAPASTSAAKLTSFGKSLSQMFLAPRTHSNAVPEENDIAEDEETDDRVASAQVIESSPEDFEEVHHTNSERFPDNHSTALAAKEERDKGPLDLSMLDPSMILRSVDEEDEEYADQDEKEALEEARGQNMIEEAENAAALFPQENLLRTKVLLKGSSRRKEMTVNLIQAIKTSALAVGQQFQTLEAKLAAHQALAIIKSEAEPLDSDKAEDKLSLTISKRDFAKMKIVGQFNLGFILAARTCNTDEEEGFKAGDDLFIIDQHASDEKYNFERLQATTIVQSQRLVHPKTLDLTAMEEEIVMENLPALETNGFIVSIDHSGEAPIGQRCQLVALPLSRETAFSLTDLDELLALLADHPANSGPVPRPSKVRKMFAMRACRSSVMIGKTLTTKQMGKLVSHLGELDKPWNCPHGRPTMRHLCGLGAWDDENVGWSEESELGGLDLAEYMKAKRGEDLDPTVQQVNEDEDEDEIDEGDDIAEV
jgi:DNA mismatch repair protein PMS2